MRTVVAVRGMLRVDPAIVEPILRDDRAYGVVGVAHAGLAFVVRLRARNDTRVVFTAVYLVVRNENVRASNVVDGLHVRVVEGLTGSHVTAVEVEVADDVPLVGGIEVQVATELRRLSGVALEDEVMRSAIAGIGARPGVVIKATVRPRSPRTCR